MKITSWKEVNKASLRGSFSITLASGLVLHGCCLFERGTWRWVGMPRQRYTDRDGNTKFTCIVEFTDDHTAKSFRDQTIAALKDGGYIDGQAA